MLRAGTEEHRETCTGEACEERRSAERLSYLAELGWRALTRREKDMRRWFAVNNKCFPMAAEVVISLLLALPMGLTLSSMLQAQGPALTTISDTVYRADGTAASGTVLISWPSFQTAVGDAVAEVKEAAHYTTKAVAGRGAIREAIEVILKAKGIWEEMIDKARA